MGYPFRAFDKNLNLLTEIDLYESGFFERGLLAPGPFEITINANMIDGLGVPYYQYFTRGNFVMFNRDVKKIGIIEKVTREFNDRGKVSERVTITGREAWSIFDRRICIPSAGNQFYLLNTNAENVMKTAVSDQAGTTATVATRKFNNMTIATNQNRGNTYLLSSKNKSLLSELMSCAIATGIGPTCYLDTVNQKLVFDVVVGTNRAASQSVNARVIFDPSFDTVKSAKLVDSDQQLKNVAVLGGSGSVANRTMQTVYNGAEPSDVDRREVFVDARDLTATSDLTAAGLSALVGMAYTSFQDVQALAVSQNVYGIDYFLGDTVTVQALGSSSDVQLTKIRESVSHKGNRPSYDITFGFGKPVPTLTDQVAATLANLAQAGIKVGASIVNTGSNANGTYIQFDDGTMMQWGSKSTTVSAVTSFNEVITLPSNFIDANYSFSTGFDSQPDTDASVFSSNSSVATKTSSQFGYQVVTRTAATTITGTVVANWQAIGRWRA